jgi:hypothetical protein
MGIQHHAAAEGFHGGIETQNVPISVLDDHGSFKPELYKGLLSRRELVRPEERDPADGFLRAVVEPDTRTGLEPREALFEKVEL